MGWDEIQIDKLIKTNRKKLEKEIGNSGTQFPLFKNPTEITPVETSEFLSHLYLECLDPVLKEMFPRLKYIKPRVHARVRLIVFIKLRGVRNLKEAYRILQTNPRVAENLGFYPNNLPSYETIRHFINDLLAEKVDKVFYQAVKEIDRKMKKKGEKLGKGREDATVITAKRNDNEADYSGYYKTKGWKKDLLVSKQGIFLSYKDMGINNDEEYALPYHLKKLKEIGINLDSLTVDGGYPSYENIAITHCGYQTNLLYKPQKHWVYNEKGTPRKIRERYSRYWKDEWYKPDATIEYELRFLYKKSERKYVGAYFRNLQVKKYEASEEMRNEITQGRNENEGFNSYLKQRVGFESELPRKGKKNAFFHTTLCLLALNMVALTRLQNGITENLTSVAYLA
ncbi:MAG: hypothetical protein U9R21_04030 [Candidatus Thermoplasmatota archaeon]|nr:hypothetical protein [Candidatus Thermoplasmatota archaeon]